MRNKLTELTDRVLKDVIKNEVILPSTYKEHFDTHAKAMNIEHDYEKLAKEAYEETLNDANDLMEKTSCNLEHLERTTHDAHEAIMAKDEQKLAAISKDIAELKSAVGSLRNQLHTDSLTHIHNRKWLHEHLLHKGTFKHDGTLAFIGLDRFKEINEEHGHVIGDKVLQYLAGFLKKNLKGMDIIRYAGDEFIIVSRGEKLEECFTKMRSLQEELLSKKLKATNGNLLYLAFSFGLTRFNVGSNFRDVLEIADALMYENKKHKRAS